MVQCKAKSKRSQMRCRKDAVRGKLVCMFHGAYSGPKTAEGIARIKKAKTTHGKFTKEAFKERRELRQMLKDSKDSLDSCNV